MKTIEKHGFPKGIASDDGRKQSIPENSEVGDSCDYERKEFSDCSDGNRRRQEFVVYVVSIMRTRRNEYRCGIVDRVAEEFEEAL